MLPTALCKKDSGKDIVFAYLRFQLVGVVPRTEVGARLGGSRYSELLEQRTHGLIETNHRID
jgi:hypothetical protein